MLNAVTLYEVEDEDRYGNTNWNVFHLTLGAYKAAPPS